MELLVARVGVPTSFSAFSFLFVLCSFIFLSKIAKISEKVSIADEDNSANSSQSNTRRDIALDVLNARRRTGLLGHDRDDPVLVRSLHPAPSSQGRGDPPWESEGPCRMAPTPLREGSRGILKESLSP